MKKFEVKELSKEELIKRISEEEANLIDLRFALTTKQLVNTAKIKQTKRDIARMKTILNEMEKNINSTKKTQS